MTIALYVSEEMCARMGVVTGKGLSDLIREEFGFRSTFFVMLAALAVDLGNTVAEFAGVAAAMQIFGISKYISVPLAGLAVWFLVVRGSARQVEKIFLVACGFYITYVFSAILAKPDWLLAAKETVVPSLHFNSGYLLMLTALVGTTIAPWQFFYLAGGIRREKGWRAPVQARQARRSRRQHLLHGHRFLHHCLLRGHIECSRPYQHHRRGAGRAGVAPCRGPLGRRSLRVRLAERLLVRCLNSSSLYRSRDLRGPWIRSGTRPQGEGSSRLLFALHWADRCRRGHHSFAQRAAAEDSGLLPGCQRRLAAGRADLYSVC